MKGCNNCVTKYSGTSGRWQDANDNSPLMLAVLYSKPQFVDLLISVCARHQNRSKQTATMLAALKGMFDIVAKLLPYEHGIKSKNGSTAFNCAIP